MTDPFFTSESADPHSLARAGRIRIAPGVEVATPVFMPVGTAGSVKGLWQEDLEEIGYNLILGNTYHLFLRPGHELIAERRGLHGFMGWPGAILTDSGGYQVFSLSDRVKFTYGGVEFASHIDGSRHMFTPERVIDIQRALGSNIMMVLDDCPPGDAPLARVAESLDRTHRWAAAAWDYYRGLVESDQLDPTRQRLFGIAQGCLDLELRGQSLETIQALPFAGIAIGGLSVGESREQMYSVLAFLGPRMDSSRPRYLMGVGAIPDVLEAVRNGIDMFDCVLPTRNARNGQLFTRRGRINIRNAQYARRDDPPDPECGCRVCRRYSLAYLRHLFQAGEMLGPMAATYHNLYFMREFMAAMGDAIRAGRFSEFYSHWKKIEEGA
jgi:queuine tRNA-ribosyltransferase